MTDTARAKLIMKKALRRMEAGRKKYGSFCPVSDKRDMYSEAEDELLDCINYLCMEIDRLRHLKKLGGK